MPWEVEMKSFLHFNRLLYITHEEEMAMTHNQIGAYFLNWDTSEKLDFCGLWSIFSILNKAKET